MSIEAAVQIMEHLCTHDWHGYTQGNRWGDGEYEQVDTVDGKITIETGDRDCSSAVISSMRDAGIPVGNATYTGNMRSQFCANGWSWHGMDYCAKRGDVYLSEANHTALCISDVPDLLAQFSISENGGIYGVVGDQTGQESVTNVPYYDYPWDGILHYEGGSAGGNSAPSAPDTSTNSGDAPESIRYAVYTEDDGWLPFVNNLDDYAGERGHWIRYIAIDMGGHGWYQVKTRDNGWLPAVTQCNINDLEDGCAGDGSPIIAVRCYYYTQNAGVTGWWRAKYRVSPVNGAYYDWQYDDEQDASQDGYAGDCVPIDRFQITLSR